MEYKIGFSGTKFMFVRLHVKIYFCLKIILGLSLFRSINLKYEYMIMGLEGCLERYIHIFNLNGHVNFKFAFSFMRKLVLCGTG